MTKKKAKKRITKKKKVVKKQYDPLNQIPKVTPHPTAGPKVQEFEDRLDEQLAGDEPKRGPGRPRKEQLPIEPENLTPDVIVGVVKIPFELWAIDQDVKELALEDDEAKQLSEPIKQLLDYYMPKIPAIAYAWISLSISSFWIMRSRMLLIQAIKESNSLSSQADDKDIGHGGLRPPPPVNTKFPPKTEPVKM